MRKILLALTILFTLSAITACKPGVYYPSSQATAYEHNGPLVKTAPVPTASPVPN